MAKLVIIAAGNGTRMGVQTIPKVLYPILGSSNLQRTYEFAKDLFETIYVVVKMNDKKLFERFKMLNKMDKLEIVPIVSGKGDGHAVMEALTFIEDRYTKMVMMWGDAVLMGPEIFKEMLDIESEAPIVFPVRFEENPYVWFQQDEDGYVTSANFSKKGEVVAEGYHDQSLFWFKQGNNVLALLTEMHNILYRNEVYLTGELNFLHLIHYLYNKNTPAEFYETDFQTFGFNTVLEAEQIEKSLKTVKLV